MRFLTFEQWKPYFWDEKNERFIGTKFEDIAAELLMLEYPAVCPGEIWQRTEKSWDGKRDFYQELFNGGHKLLRWAECKAYRAPISFNILAPTLIMSTLHDAGEVIFFSYSSLNREAVKELQEFAEIHGKRVSVYDDQKLENLILKYKDNEAFSFHRFFPNADSASAIAENTIPVTYTADCYLYRRGTSYTIGEMKKQRLQINEMFELRISLVNQTLSEQTVHMEMDMRKSESYRFLDCEERQLNINKKVVLRSGELRMMRIPFKVTGFSHRIALPQIRLTCNEKDLLFPQSDFRCGWLLETPYLGDMEQFEQDSQAVMCDYETVLTVFGSAGAGKTRYLQELQTRRLLFGRKCLWSDATHSDGNAVHWLRQVLSRLYALPMIRLEQYNANEFPNVKARIVTDVLYDEKFVLDPEKIDQAGAALLGALAQQDVMLIVDNVQDFDDNTIRILNSVLNRIADAHGAHLLLSFNTDILYRQETAISLFGRLQRLYQDDRLHYPLREIKGLGDYFEQFIKSCFLDRAVPPEENDRMLSLLAQRLIAVTNRNPLYTEQLLLYLCDEENVFRRQDNHLYLFNNRALSERLSKLPTTIESLFQKRWSALRKSAGNEKARLETVLRFICFFRELPAQLIRVLDLDEDAVDLLVEAGFLRWETGLVFYHPLIERFFFKKYPMLKTAEASACVRALNETCLDATYPAQFYICVLQQRRTPQTAEIEQAVRAMTRGRIPPELLSVYGQVLFSALERHGSMPNGSPKLLMRFYIAYGEEQKKRIPMSEIVRYYESVYQKYWSVFDDFRQFGALYFTFIREYLNALLTERHNKAAVELGNELLNRFDTFRFENANQAERARAMILNRLHVALDRLEPPEAGVPDSPHAQELLKEALSICESINYTSGIVQNEIDYGYVFALFGGPVEDVVYHWRRAAQTWHAQRDEAPLWEGGVLYHEAWAHVLTHEWEQAEIALEGVVLFHERTLHNPYYYIKALTLRALLLLIELHPFEEISHALDTAEKACTESGYKGVFPLCSHIRALACDLLQTENDMAKIYFEKALTQYIDCFEGPWEEERSLDTLLTVALALRRLAGPKDYPVLSRLKSPDVSAQLRRILNADETTWPDICAEAPPKGLLYLESRGINYPCVV